jgi:hypothetical protein
MTGAGEHAAHRRQVADVPVHQKSAMIAAWFNAIEYRLHIHFLGEQLGALPKISFDDVAESADDDRLQPPRAQAPG